MPGIEIKLITGAKHEFFFTDEEERIRFLDSLTAMPGIIAHRLTELDTTDWYDNDRG